MHNKPARAGRQRIPGYEDYLGGKTNEIAMLEKLGQSTGNVLGYKAIGKITKDDYTIVTADVEALLQQDEGLCLLLDLEEAEGAKINAWGADIKFGRKYRKKIAKLAIVGDNKRHDQSKGNSQIMISGRPG